MMTLKTTTDFEEALQLIGYYQQEVKKTGILEYPYHWQPESAPPLEPTPEIEPSATPTGASVNNFELSCDIPLPTPAIASSSSDEIVVSCPFTNPPEPNSEPSPLVQKAPEPVAEQPENLNEQKQKLLKQQEEERKLLYLYLQEIEKTVNIAQIPNFIKAKF